MTEREKLIDLVNIAIDARTGQVLAERIADHLLSNGVTIQKWIPVTERLPESGKIVLVYGSRGGIYTAYCNRRYQNVGWHKMNSKSHYCNPTHWMPLPSVEGLQ